VRTRAIPERLRGVITTRRYAICISPCRDHTSKARKYGTRSHSPNLSTSLFLTYDPNSPDVIGENHWL